jgi:hypothetical protein
MNKRAVKLHAILPGRVGFKYGDVGHFYVGAIIWWLGHQGKLNTVTSTGSETHHDLDHRVNMDAHWRGRIDPGSGTATLLPPLNEYNRLGVSVRLPLGLMGKLKRLGAQQFFIDTPMGLRNLR